MIKASRSVPQRPLSVLITSTNFPKFNFPIFHAQGESGCTSRDTVNHFERDVVFQLVPMRRLNDERVENAFL